MKKMLTVAMVMAVALTVSPALAQEGGDVQPGMKVALPLNLYVGCEVEGDPVFIPAGWMGNTDAIEYDNCWPERPRSGEHCIRVTFSDPRGWGGIVWQNPANNWGDDFGGVDLTGAKKLTFWARGDKGGEMVEFKMGIIPRNKPFYDTGRAGLGRVRLENTWQKYEIDLEGKDLSRIVTGFVFSVPGRPDPVIFYLDDIVYE